MAPPSQYASHNERQPFSMSSHSSQATRTSRSPPFFNGMDRAMPPVKMSPQIHVYEPYLSISPSGSSGREQYPAFSSAAEFPSRQIMVQDSSQLHQPENPIARFIHEDSSWDPLGGRQNGVPLNLGVFPEYTVYRNTTAPSEVDTIGPATIISDSAYGSMPRQSVGQPSVYGDMDHCAETQSLIQGVSDFQFHPGLSPDAIPPRGDQSEKKSWDQHGAPANPETNSLVCPHCKAQVKTKSELKKHEQRHSKPHRCNIENCPRNGDGFSTLNDLARHRQTVHKIGGHKYRCHIGQCANKKKDWPRADNFKQHLQRVHNFQTNDLEKFKATSSEATQQSHSGLPESAPPQPSVQTVPVSHWGQTLTINAAMNHLAEPIPRQLVTNPQLSVGSPSIDGSTLGDIDESQYADQIPFDGMGLDGKMGNIIPQLEPTTQNLPSDRGSSDQTIDTPHSYINPDILNHIGLRTFPGDQTGPKNIPSEILELESEGPTTFNQDEQETDFRADQRAFPVIPCKMIADYNQDVASEHEDSNDSDLTGASDRAEHSPSPRAESDADSPPKAESEALKLDAHTAASSPESMNLDETDASDLVQRLMQKQVLDKLLQQFGYRMVKESDIKDQTKESAISEPQTNVPGGRHACDQCNKTFSRACELRKHRKRHDKPYACTYAQCKKRFGSKNDWKRHENSQHFQLECWKCNEKPKDFPNEICGKVCHRRETFTNHLEKDHGLDQKAIEGKWATCRVGRNCETQFWCGFCKAVVELVNGLAWTERFNHIDEHFNGRNGKPKADISEWETVESESSEPVEFLQSPKPQASRGRPLSTEQSKKRGRSGSTDGSSRIHSKKFRAEDGELFWSCCECSTMWNPATTGTSCLTCRHDQCPECPMEAHKITEDVATVS